MAKTAAVLAKEAVEWERWMAIVMMVRAKERVVERRVE